MRVDELRSLSLFDGLTDDQLAELMEGSTEVRFEPGVDLFREGEHADFWWVLVDGAIDLLRRIGREETAVDAMDGAGTLRLATRAEGNDVVIEVGDTGPGMPPQVAPRAFEAFYTTKDAGQGTGLGLDIARRIVVERHGGTIAIQSRPGETVLCVRLPLRPPER